MKLQIVSDYHLEFFDDNPVIKNAGADILILSGDICVAERLYKNPIERFEDPPQSKDWYGWDAKRFRDFFEQVSKEFDQVLYVAGNHEHYHGHFDRTINVLTSNMPTNVHVLDKSVYNPCKEDIVFFGATFWTDYAGGNPLVMQTARNYMNDHKCITYSNAYRKFTPERALQDHKEAIDKLKAFLSDTTKRVVVVGHHAPSPDSIHEKYKKYADLNHAYFTDLRQIMHDHPNIVLWTHGHVHTSFDYVVNNTRVICNPHGYGNENPEFNPELIAEI